MSNELDMSLIVPRILNVLELMAQQRCAPMLQPFAWHYEDRRDGEGVLLATTFEEVVTLIRFAHPRVGNLCICDRTGMTRLWDYAESRLLDSGETPDEEEERD